MKRIKYLVPIFIIMLLTSSTCEKEDKNCHYRITFNNNSSKSKYVTFSLIYPDTTSFYLEGGVSASTEKVAPFSDNNSALRKRNCFEKLFNTDLLMPSDTLSVFVFDASVVETMPWDSVGINYLVEKRYDFTLQELRNINWVINYP